MLAWAAATLSGLISLRRTSPPLPLACTMRHFSGRIGDSSTTPVPIHLDGLLRSGVHHTPGPASVASVRGIVRERPAVPYAD